MLSTLNIKKFLISALMLVSIQGLATERYTVDPEHTFATFEYDHLGLSLQRARFDRTSGFIGLDLAARSGVINIEIDTASVSTGSDVFNKLLRSADYFDVATYPKSIFKSTALRFSEDRLTQVSGELTINGIQRPVTFDITRYHCRFVLMTGKRTCGANGQAKILRSDFNLGRYVPFVSDAVTLFFSVEASKELAPEANAPGQ